MIYTIPLSCILGFLGLLSSSDPKTADPKPVQALVIETTAEKLAEEFVANPAEAAKKYNPTPPKGVLGGTLISFGGEVQGIGQTGIITLRNSAGVTLLVTVPSLPKDPKARQLANITTSKFISFKDKVLQIEAADVKYQNIIGK